ncbi:YrhC family protein, partial [Priestia megaterium]
MKAQHIKAKIEDYSRFIYVLLAVSTFLYIGVMIGQGEKSDMQLGIMEAIVILFAALAFYFSYQTKK